MRRLQREPLVDVDDQARRLVHTAVDSPLGATQYNGDAAGAECEADALVELARAELRRLGARPRRLAFSGVEGLTPTERQIAAMAASGMTNRQIAQDPAQ